MQPITATLSIGLALALAQPSPAAAATGGFPTCADSHNYGHSTASLYVGQAFSRLGCEAAGRPVTEAAIARAFKRLVLRGSDSVAIKSCYYEGLYRGYVTALQAEYGRCGAQLSLASIAQAAEAVFVALYGALGNNVDECMIQETFGIEYGFVPSASESGACSGWISGAAYDDLGSSAIDHLVEELIEVVCYRPAAG
jgi:hypothetical protein